MVHLADFGARIEDVREDHRGATENPLFQGDTFIHTDIVLNLAFVADDCGGADDNILTDVAVVADF